MDLLRIRDKINSSNILDTRSALIQRDGDIVDVDGTSPVIFPLALNDDYYVTVRHRNHLALRTNAPIALSATSTNLDFSSAALTIFESRVNVDLGSGVLGMGGGNANVNNSVRATGPAPINDYANLLSYLGTPTSIQTNVYVPQDFNMDGTVRATRLPQINDYSKLLNILGSPVTIKHQHL